MRVGVGGHQGSHVQTRVAILNSAILFVVVTKRRMYDRGASPWDPIHRQSLPQCLLLGIVDLHQDEGRVGLGSKLPQCSMHGQGPVTKASPNL